MKIAFLSTFYPFRGGIAQFNAAMFQELVKTNEVKAFNFSRQYPKLLFPGKSQYIENTDTEGAIPSSRVLDSINPFTFFKTAKAINAFNPDVLIVRHWISFLAPALGIVCRLIKPGIKILILVDNAISHDPKGYDKLLAKILLNKGDGYLCLTESVKQDLAGLLNTKNKLFCVLPHPQSEHFGEKIDKAVALQKLNLNQDRKTILFFGFIRPYKGLDVLLDAFERINHHNNQYQLLIAGECYGSFESYQKQIDLHPMKDNIVVHNQYISDEMVPFYFSGADVCVLPYKSATQSGITSIAHFYNLPVIATNVGGLKETIKHNENGLLVNECNAELFANAINQYFDKELGEGFEISLSKQKGNDNWMFFIQETLAFCDKLVSQ
jgi:glycosyltransferase involved in cell wall biosynthesis